MGTTFYFALIGGQMLKRFDLLFSYYVGFFLFGIVTYFILSRLTNYKVFKGEILCFKSIMVHTYKQSKYIVWLFWLVSFYVLSYKYYLAAAEQLKYFHEHNEWKYIYRYYYQLSLPDAIMVQGGLLIILACILIGWERQNQSSDILWSMPFKRKHLFITKWLLVCVIL